MNTQSEITFNNSFIWPDNSNVKWEMEGIGRVNGKVKFIIRTNRTSLRTSCFVSVMDDNDNKWCIEDSPIFWNVNEWVKACNIDPEYAMKNQHYLARQEAMRWAENFLRKLL